RKSVRRVKPGQAIVRVAGIQNTVLVIKKADAPGCMTRCVNNLDLAVAQVKNLPIVYRHQENMIQTIRDRKLLIVGDVNFCQARYRILSQLLLSKETDHIEVVRVGIDLWKLETATAMIQVRVGIDDY